MLMFLDKPEIANLIFRYTRLRKDIQNVLPNGERRNFHSKTL